MRRAELVLEYESKDISADIAPMLSNFTFTDNASGTADDVQIQVHDAAELWHKDWFPSKGAKIRVGLMCRKWNQGEDVSVNFGVFTIDEVTASGPPDTFSIKAISAFIDTSIRNEKKSRAYEQFSLRDIVSYVADKHGFALFFDSDINPQIERADQAEESDLAFLQRICTSHGVKLKVTDRKIAVYNAAKYDSKDPVMSISKWKHAKTWSFTAKAYDIYKACSVNYWDAKEKKQKSYTFTPDNAPETGHILKINERVESPAKAEQRAKNELRKKNKEEVSASIDVMGTPQLAAGSNVKLDSFGVFSGKYMIESCTHSLGGNGYTTSLTLKKVLGY